MTYICPCCRREIVDGDECPGCAVPFRASDWPEIAVTPAGRVRAEDGSYCFPAPETVVRGELPRPYTEELPSPDVRDRISVGGEKQHVAIADVTAPLAEFYRHLIPDGDEWWVVRCRAAAKIILNGKKEVDNCRLSEGDVVTIAGVSFLFTGKSLRIGQFEQPEISVETRGLSVVKSGKTILKDINFKIEPGEFIGILGPSGCGKSSLIQQLVGLGRATSGTISVNGTPYSESAGAMRKLTAYMPQTVALHNELTLEEEIACFSLLHGNSLQEAEAKLALVGMWQETAKRIGDLSGGQQRRVGIALELLREPRMLILDEPTAGLDPASETQVMTYLRRLADQGRSVLCATHIMENLDKFDKVLVLSRGYGVFFGTPAELLASFRISRPQELYDLLGAGSETQQRERAEELARKFRDSRKNDSAGEADKQFSPLPKCGRGASLKDQYLGYLGRQAMEFFSFRHAAHPFRAFWISACFIQLLLQPILIASVLKFACARFFEGTEALNRFDLCFFSCLAVFWLGLNDAIRELVRERIPWRCLERLEKVSMTAYVGAKLSWTALLAVAETLIFYLIVYELSPVSVISPGAKVQPIVLGFAGFLILCWVCIVGAWIGLAISAVFTSEKAAIAMLPIVVVPVLFFSSPIIGITHKDDLCNEVAVSNMKWMPCYEPAEYLTRHSQSINADPWIPIKNGGWTVLISLMILTTIQFVWEKKWEGR